MSKWISHDGTPRHSGRYPWGSGQNPEQRGKSFLGAVKTLKKEGLSEVEIAKSQGMNTAQLRKKKSIDKASQKKEVYTEIVKLRDKGVSKMEIGRRLGINESSVRDYLKKTTQERSAITGAIADKIRARVNEKELLDVGIGLERYMGVSRTRLKTALSMLEEEGYTTHLIDVPQLGTTHVTKMLVLSKPNVTTREVYLNKEKISLIDDYSEDGGRSFLGLEPIRNIDSKRIKIQHAEEGGTDKDGVIELRRGVPELSLGEKRYAQVRIGVDDTHFLKGMAIYADDLPDGVDIRFNTNKSKNVPMIGPKNNTILKLNEKDEDNPFGSIVRQRHYIDADGKEQLSALNRVGYKDDSGEEGAWGSWAKTLSSQMLSKQNPVLAKKQLELSYDIKKEEYDEIMSFTNPVVKKVLLDTFSDDCDSGAVHLKAAALPRQRSHVILPLLDIKETEVYAPNYRNGEKVVLIRYPHGGIFEIPELTVNNKNKTGKRLYGANAEDAVGIHPKVAQQLSGADFDGDTVLVIPNGPGVGIRTSPSLNGLKDFDPRILYKLPEGAPKMTKVQKGIQMGQISNLITDMTVKGGIPNPEEITRAIKHSMVVIDAEKHGLDFNKSYIDNNIAALKKKYQGSARSGASTLISKASSDYRVDERKSYSKTDPATGKKVYEYTGNTYVQTKKGSIDPNTGKPTHTTVLDKEGNPKIVKRQQPSTKMAETEDAFSLSSGTSMEDIYAVHANRLKALANTARKSSIETEKMVYSPSANKTFESEVSSLTAHLNLALKNAPLERHANLTGNIILAAKKASNPSLEPSEIKKLKGQILTDQRNRIGAKKQRIDITAREWEAIQSGAISATTLLKIIKNTDIDKIKQLATPRAAITMTSTKIAKANVLLAAGHTQAEVADQLGVSVTTLSKSL